MCLWSVNMVWNCTYFVLLFLTHIVFRYTLYISVTNRRLDIRFQYKMWHDDVVMYDCMYECITCSNSAVSTVRPVMSSILWLTLAMTGSSSPSNHALRNMYKHTVILNQKFITIHCSHTHKRSHFLLREQVVAVYSEQAVYVARAAQNMFLVVKSEDNWVKMGKGGIPQNNSKETPIKIWMMGWWVT